MSEKVRSDLHVAVLVFPFPAPNTLDFASKLMHILASVTADPILVAGGIPNNVARCGGVHIRDIGMRLHYVRERQPAWFSALLWVGKALLAQIRLAIEVLRLRHEVDLIICFMGSYYQLPILVAKLLGKKVLSTSWGSHSIKARINYGSIVAGLAVFSSRLSFTLSDGVLVDSLRYASSPELVPFRSKLYNGAMFFENPELFRIQISVMERENLVGFVGRLVPEKGVMEYLHSIPLVLDRNPDIKFLIAGTGRLDETLERAIEGQSWSGQVEWLRWVEHERMPDLLNRLRLLVIPSFEEGLPNLILEAMGCGTPVLATDVGGIPDLVMDGETGFLLGDNSPHTIAGFIVRVMNDPRLEAVTQQARALIERDYSEKAARKRYRTILNDVMGGHTSLEEPQQ